MTYLAAQLLYRQGMFVSLKLSVIFLFFFIDFMTYIGKNSKTNLYKFTHNSQGIRQWTIN